MLDAPAATPMMAQYLEIRAEAPDALLFYRMGDFYELFFDDAAAAAAALDIALTTRGEHAGAPIPMCGVPVHSAEGYLMTLIRKGFRVAVCEQLERPEEAKKRGSKAVVKRGITRLVTPGTLTEDALLEARASNHLAAHATVREAAALAWTDISTGALHVARCPLPRLGADLARLGVREVVLAEASGPAADVAREAGAAVAELGRGAFDSASATADRLQRLFGVATLDGFGSFDRAEVAALGALIEYVELTQRGRLPALRPPRREAAEDAMQIDAATRRSLEILRGTDGRREGSLLHAVDRTVTAGGARLLERRLSAPSTRPDIVGLRHDALSQWALSIRPDRRRPRATGCAARATWTRALSRLSLDRGGPRDLAAIRAGLEAARDLAALGTEGAPPGPVRPSGATTLLRDLLDRALVAEPPQRLSDGGSSSRRDSTRRSTRRGRLRDRRAAAWSRRLQAKYADLTGVASLKVKHNNVLGYFVETTATHEATMRGLPDTFIHRQTTASQLRWTTVELSDLQSRILGAGARADEIEARVFAELRAAALAEADALHRCAAALAELDVTAALAELARPGGWCRPVVDASRAFEVTAGRHPVVERALTAAGQPFVANDTALSAGDVPAIRLLTGPNMAGKSTWLRQSALIAVLAQAGAYVPAEAAHLGVVTRLYSRVGASDDLARGRSTFMVEMVETAAILNGADDRALVILDEIGRGTATYDGLSIAWAVLEHLHEVNRCRALFATHYHELTALADRLEGVEALHVAVREWEGDVVFLHEVRAGAADRSYGVQVARLAGLPERATARAAEVLARLEDADRDAGPRAVIDDLPLFAAAPPPRPAPSASPGAVEAALRDVRPDDLTAREALDLIYALKERLAEE